MTRRNSGPDKTAGFGWVGLWPGDGTMGAQLPLCLTGSSGRTQRPGLCTCLDPNKRFVKCLITLKAVRDSHGRPIIRTAKSLGAYRKPTQTKHQGQ